MNGKKHSNRTKVTQDPCNRPRPTLKQRGNYSPRTKGKGSKP